MLSYERAVEIVQKNELDEILTYFPEFADALNEVKSKINELTSKIMHAWKSFSEQFGNSDASRKEKAIAIQKEFGPKLSGIGFALLDNKISSIDEWIHAAPTAKIVNLLDVK